MLLTAGYGERMYPLTATLPKPAIPVLGRPLVIQAVRWLSRLKPEQVVLNLHHLPEVLEDLLGDGSDYGLPPIRFQREEEILGTAGGIRNARELLEGDGPLVVSNGDMLSDIDLEAAVRSHIDSGLPATIVVTDPRDGYGTVEVGRDGRVLRLRGQPEVAPELIAGSFLFTGCQILDDEVLDAIPPGGPADTVGDIFIDLARERRLGSFHHSGFWREFGSPLRYHEGCADLLEHSVRERRRLTDHDPVRRLGRSVGALGPGAKYDRRASFLGFNALGFASMVSPGSRLQDTIVMPESWIGPDCRLTGCVVGPGVELPSGFEAHRSLIAVFPEGDDPRAAGLPRVGDLAVVPFDQTSAA